MINPSMRTIRQKVLEKNIDYVKLFTGYEYYTGFTLQPINNVDPHTLIGRQ